jgi:replicative DNA helicase
VAYDWQRKAPQGGHQEQIPPQNIQAEQAVLGACLGFGKTALPVALEILSGIDFYRPMHGRIFETLCGLFIENIPIDLVSVCDALSRAGKLEEVGGRLYLVSLMQAVATGANVGHHCKIVKEHSTRRKLIAWALETQSQAYDGQKNSSELISQAGEGLFSLARGDADSGHRKAGRLDFDHYIREYVGVPGLPWGIKWLDENTGGQQNGDLIILSGREKLGKTAAAMHIARHNAKAGNIVLDFSLEMSAKAKTQRIFAAESRVPSLNISRNRMTNEQRFAVDNFLKSDSYKTLQENYLVDDRPMTPKTFPTTVRLYMHQYKVSLLILDYINLFAGDDPKEVNDAYKLLKLMAKEYNIPFLVLSARRRPQIGEEHKPPQATDLRMAGEYHCDYLLFLHNPAVELFDQPRNTLTAKQLGDIYEWENRVRWFVKYDRAGGAKGSFDMFFQRDCGFFGDIETTERSEPPF